MSTIWKLHKNRSFHMMNKRSSDANMQYEIATCFPYFSKLARFHFPSMFLKKCLVSAEKSFLEEVATRLLKKGNESLYEL